MAIHVQAIRKLAPEDFILIEVEHARLHGSISNLRSTCSHLQSPRGCQGCGREKLATCRGRLVSFAYNILDFSANHFVHEEAIMVKGARSIADFDAYVSHRKSHRQMLDRLNCIGRESTLLDEEDRTADAYRRLYAGMTEVFQEHERLFDEPFIQSTKTHDNVLRGEAMSEG